MKLNPHFGMLPELAFISLGGRMTLEGGKGAPVQQIPDYKGAAEADAQSSKEVTAQNVWANRPTVNTPWGSQTWEAGLGTDPATGTPVTTWNQNVALTPAEQSALSDQQAITAGRSDAAKQLLGQATSATATPMDWDKLPEVGTLDERQQGAFAKMSEMLQPGRRQQQESLDVKLANSGLPINSEAYRRANAGLAENWAQQDKGLLSQALAEGRGDVTTMTGIRQQAISDEAQRRGMSLNELNALLTGQQVNMPTGMGTAPNTTAGTAQGSNQLGAAIGQGNFATSANQMSQGSDNTGAIIGGIAAVAAAF